MSHRMIRVVVHTLLTDEELRLRFAISPLEALADLNLRGVELTADEMEVLARTDSRLWFWSRELLGEHVH